MQSQPLSRKNCGRPKGQLPGAKGGVQTPRGFRPLLRGTVGRLHGWSLSHLVMRSRKALLYQECFRSRYQEMWLLAPGMWRSGKKSACQCRRHRRCRLDPWIGNIPWRRKWQPAPVFLLGEFQGQRSLAGYSPQGHKESDMTEPTHTHQIE